MGLLSPDYDARVERKVRDQFVITIYKHPVPYENAITQALKMVANTTYDIKDTPTLLDIVRMVHQYVVVDFGVTMKYRFNSPKSVIISFKLGDMDAGRCSIINEVGECTQIYNKLLTKLNGHTKRHKQRHRQLHSPGISLDKIPYLL